MWDMGGRCHCSGGANIAFPSISVIWKLDVKYVVLNDGSDRSQRDLVWYDAGSTASCLGGHGERNVTLEGCEYWALLLHPVSTVPPWCWGRDLLDAAIARSVTGPAGFVSWSTEFSSGWPRWMAVCGRGGRRASW